MATCPLDDPVLDFLGFLHPSETPNPAVGEHQHQVTCLPRDPSSLSPGTLTVPAWGWGAGTELLETHHPPLTSLSLSPGLDTSSQSSSQEFLVPNDVRVCPGMVTGTTACPHPCVPTHSHFAGASTGPQRGGSALPVRARERLQGQKQLEGKLRHGKGKGLGQHQRIALDVSAQ